MSPKRAVPQSGVLFRQILSEISIPKTIQYAVE